MVRQGKPSKASCFRGEEPQELRCGRALDTALHGASHGTERGTSQYQDEFSYQAHGAGSIRTRSHERGVYPKVRKELPVTAWRSLITANTGRSRYRPEGRDMKEIWKPIPDYEGFYEASNLGNIRSVKRSTTRGRILKQHIGKRNGYCHVSLSKHNVIVTRRVHKLVYMAFHPDIYLPKGYDKRYTLDHVDGDKTNNRLDNLELCSQSENQLRAYRLGINGKSTRKVIDITTGKVFESLTDAALSVGSKSRSAITRVCKGNRSQYRDHKFAYLEDYENGTIPEFKGKAKASCKRLWVS